MIWARRILISIIVVIWVSQIGMTLFAKTSRGDLGLVLDAATRLRTGQPLYDAESWHTHTKPPLTTLAFVPLSYLDRFAAERVWDVLLILCFIIFARWTVGAFPHLSKASDRTLLFLAFATTFNSWNSELNFGQFNLLLLMASAAAVYASNSYLGGAAYTFGLFFKPTQVVFLPWIFVHGRWMRAAAGGVTLLAALATIYGASFGWERLITDHQEWLRKAGGVTPVHVQRPDNYGLPSLAWSWGMPANDWAVFQWVSIAAAALTVWRIRDRFAGFAVCAAVAVLCSPMSWGYGYVAIFPLMILVADEFYAATNAREKWLLGLSLGSHFWGTQVFNPTLKTLPVFEWMFANRPPLFGLLLALALWALARKNRFSNPKASLTISTGL